MEQRNVRQKSNCLASTKLLTPTEKGRQFGRPAQSAQGQAWHPATAIAPFPGEGLATPTASPSAQPGCNWPLSVSFCDISMTSGPNEMWVRHVSKRIGTGCADEWG
jgi:hypothetical protein